MIYYLAMWRLNPFTSVRFQRPRPDRLIEKIDNSYRCIGKRGKIEAVHGLLERRRRQTFGLLDIQRGVAETVEAWDMSEWRRRLECVMQQNGERIKYIYREKSYTISIRHLKLQATSPFRFMCKHHS